MTGHQPLQFIEHLRRAGHLKPTEAQQAIDPGIADQPQGAGPRNPQAASLAKLWEMTTLSSGEFADEAARFFGCERVALQDMLAATPLVAAFSQRFLRETLVFPYQLEDRRVVLAIADPIDLA